MRYFRFKSHLAQKTSKLHQQFRKYSRRLRRLVLPLLTTALVCIASPAFTQITNLSPSVSTGKNPNINAIASSSLTSQLTSQATNQSASSSETQARQLYREGKYSEAAQFFQRAANGYKAGNDPLRQALSLSNLSLSYQQLGSWSAAEKAITEAVNLINGVKNTNSASELAKAQVWEIQASLLLARGQGDAAFDTWRRVTKIYTDQKQPALALVSQTNQAQALQHLGLYRRSVKVLEKALSLPDVRTSKPEELKSALAKINPSAESALALRSLGDSLRVVGSFTPAQSVLERSLAIANQLNLTEVSALVNLTLGNTARAQLSLDKPIDAPIQPQATQTALKYYEQAAVNPGNLRIQARANQLSLLLDSNQLETAKNLLPGFQQEIAGLTMGRLAIDARVNLAHSMMRIWERDQTSINIKDVAEMLAIAVRQAKELDNPRIYADTLGTLGNVYEQTKQWGDAETLTQKAVNLSQQANAPDVAYRWQWQLGRVLAAQNKTDGAIAAYREAVETIKALRADLAAASPDVQFSFRDAVEPIHRQLVGLLVKSNQKDNLKTARDVIEGLQLVELDNFFREACLNAKPEQIDRVDAKAAVVYPIILDDELAVIASLPKAGAAEGPESREFRYYTNKIKRNEIERLATQLRENFNQPTTSDLVLPQLERVYDLVIRPAINDIDNSKVETLVFVLDGALRNIPMSALYDGKQFLVEKYSVALTPGLQLLAPKALKEERLGALVAGLSEARLDFSPLPHVKDEVRKIESEIPSQVLLNERFTNQEFQTRVSAVPYPIVHLATHGQFGSTADTTFILTWDGKIKVNQLSSVLKTVELSQDNTLEMLILSACETATGDARSALGLAGVAVRSGARSTVATLWRVNDEASADLMSQFYEELKQARQTGISKAEALRRAQLVTLKKPNYQSPYFWGAYVLLGNWT